LILVDHVLEQQTAARLPKFLIMTMMTIDRDPRCSNRIIKDQGIVKKG